MKKSSLIPLAVPLLLSGLIVLPRPEAPEKSRPPLASESPAPSLAPVPESAPSPATRALDALPGAAPQPAAPLAQFLAPAGTGPVPSYRPELAPAIAPERWRRLADVHKRMLDRLAPLPAAGGDAASDDPPEEADAASPGERPWVCFAPGTSDDLMLALSAFSQSGLQTRAAATPTDAFTAQAFQFLSPSRWSNSTLTPSIPNPRQGRPITLTWSFVPDGTTITGAAGEPAAPSNLRAWLDGLYGSQPVWQAFFQQSFERWEALTGVRYVYEPNDDGASFPNSPGSSGTRGDVRISGHFIDGNSGTLAYNYGPNSGDMVIDTFDTFYNTTSSNSLRLRNVIAHEHGHGLGLDHVCPVNQSKLMEPFLSTNFDGPQSDDIFSANRQYGDRLEDTDTDTTSDNNDSVPNATDLGTLAAGSTATFSNLSIDDNGDEDYYRFTAPAANAQLAVTLHPLGANYLEGAQNDDGSCTAGVLFDSRSVHDLAFELRDASGSSVLAARDDTGAAADEILPAFALPDGAGPYFVRVFRTTTTNNAQLYELRLTVTAPAVVPAVSVADLTPGEDAGTALVPVTLSEATTASVSVQYATLPGTAGAPSDFTATTGTLVFTPGLTEQNISLTLADDSLDEADETLQLILASPVNATLGDADATITITDNDPAPTLSVADVTAPEAAASLDFTVSLSAVSGLPISVEIATVPGTAEAGSDFAPQSGTLALPPGETEGTVTIALLPDDAPEADETFALGLTVPVNTTLASPAATARLLDDDAPETLAGTGAITASVPGPGFEINWLAIPGRTYTIDASENLIDWFPLPEATRLTTGTFALPPAPETRRFYRVRDDPEP